MYSCGGGLLVCPHQGIIRGYRVGIISFHNYKIGFFSLNILMLYVSAFKYLPAEKSEANII
jgi:hypothetical protein